MTYFGQIIYFPIDNDPAIPLIIMFIDLTIRNQPFTGSLKRWWRGINSCIQLKMRSVIKDNSSADLSLSSSLTRAELQGDLRLNPSKLSILILAHLLVSYTSCLPLPCH